MENSEVDFKTIKQKPGQEETWKVEGQVEQNME
jgi:hypothetical protein